VKEREGSTDSNNVHFQFKVVDSTKHQMGFFNVTSLVFHKLKISNFYQGSDDLKN
jgi:hypothetical protein